MAATRYVFEEGTSRFGSIGWRGVILRVWKALIRRELREGVSVGWRCFEPGNREYSTVVMLNQYLLPNGIHSTGPPGDPRADIGPAVLRPYTIVTDWLAWKTLRPGGASPTLQRSLGCRRQVSTGSRDKVRLAER